jgi:hypothetical protein
LSLVRPLSLFSLLSLALCVACDGSANLSLSPSELLLIEPPMPPQEEAPLPPPDSELEAAAAAKVKPNGETLRALSAREYLYSVSDLFGVELPVSLIKDWTPDLQFSGFDAIQWSNFDTKLARDRLATVEKMIDAGVVSPSVMTCQAASAAELEYPVCAQKILEPLAVRAFRRPLTAEEGTALRLAYTSGLQLARDAVIADLGELLTEGVRAGLGHLLLAPQFMIKLERAPGSGERLLTAHELASKLSFFLTASIPDPELRFVANNGELLQPEVLAAQVDRLLATRGDRFVETFIGQWLSVRHLADAPPGSLERSMWTETQLVLLEILRRDLPISTVLKPGFTYVDAQLAAHYGLPGTFGALPTRVETQDRGGVLMQGSLLTATSTKTLTSPIRRGRYVQGRLLCSQIADVSSRIPADATVKQRMNLHKTSAPVCLSCHQYMDPIGLGLESFDQRGQRRTVYPDGRKVETDSELLGKPFQTAEELNTLLFALPEVRSCIAEKLAIHGLGRVIGTTGADADLVAYLSRPVAGKEPSFRQLIQRMVSSVAFRTVSQEKSSP